MGLLAVAGSQEHVLLVNNPDPHDRTQLQQLQQHLIAGRGGGALVVATPNPELADIRQFVRSAPEHTRVVVREATKLGPPSHNAGKGTAAPDGVVQRVPHKTDLVD